MVTGIHKTRCLMESLPGRNQPITAPFGSRFWKTTMRSTVSLALLVAVGTAWAGDPAQGPKLIAKTDAFKTLTHPDCSHCLLEASRRKQELRSDDRVLCWRQ